MEEKSQANGWGIGVGTLVFVLLLAGCGGDQGVDGSYEAFSVREGPTRSVARSMADAASVDEAVEMVKKWVAEDQLGTMEQWVEAELGRVRGDIMFPQWEATRKGAHQFDVLFTYTHRDLDYHIDKKGYRWEVNTRLNVVRGPEPWREEKEEPEWTPSFEDIPERPAVEADME